MKPLGLPVGSVRALLALGAIVVGVILLGFVLVLTGRLNAETWFTAVVGVGNLTAVYYFQTRSKGEATNE